jgi:S-adenosylmethionine synthetase
MAWPEMDTVVSYSERPPGTRELEIVERKGVGHPDTVCDAIAEEFSVALSRYYLEKFGAVLHHNLDKALLRGGAAHATFGGGEVVEPIDLYLAGRAVTEVGGVAVPVEEIAVETTRAWLRAHFHALDPVRHVRVHCLVRPGSADLTDLFRRQRSGAPLANDTSFGVGFAPLSPVERFVLDLDQRLVAPDVLSQHPECGEDAKIMAVSHGDSLTATVAQAFVAAHVASLSEYRDAKARVEADVRALARTLSESATVHVNAADAADGSSVYLTVTGTSAESGDDGEVGRGNRGNGLITPCRPMSLEALAGKNPVSHVGKLYNLAARNIAEALVAAVEGVRSVECELVSRIGAPIDEPAVAHVRFETERRDTVRLARLAELGIRAELAKLTSMWQRFVSGSVRVY